MSSDDSHNSHHDDHDDDSHGGGHDDHPGGHAQGHGDSHAEGHAGDPVTLGWDELPFDPMTKFTLLGFFVGRLLLDRDESEKQINVVLND